MRGGVDVAAFEVGVYVTQERLQVRATMIPGDVSVDVPPHPLNLVGRGAVGRQEVQHHPPAQRLERTSCFLAVVHRGIVQDDVQLRGMRIGLGERAQQRDEQVARLARASDPSQVCRPGLQGPRDIPLAHRFT